MKKNIYEHDIPKLVILELKDEFINKINSTKKVTLNKKIIVIGEDDEYYYFLDVKTSDVIDNSSLKIERLFDKNGLLNEYIDIDCLFRIKTQNLADNLELDEQNDFINYPLGQISEINILKRLIESLNKENNRYPKLINLIKNSKPTIGLTA
ncbi:hypothetical protein [Mycoplasmopsis alligatoris]|uniref:hypothetical protein n=1 Tax=Mycoplasmopsis alligatoris TaxID=47687 RepID=UPI0003098A52|nr:hypothetical protein [Mycoplasmopsis alligatoris]